MKLGTLRLPSHDLGPRAVRSMLFRAVSKCEILWENVELGRAGGYGRQRPGPEGTELKELDVVARVFAVYSCQWIDR